MNKPNSPWSIKGVSAEARDAAKEGARISRRPLGKWLSEVIRMTSAAESGATASASASAAAAGMTATMSPSSAATWQEAVVRLEARIAGMENRAAAAVLPLGDALERIGERLDSIENYVLRRPRRSYLRWLLRR